MCWTGPLNNAQSPEPRGPGGPCSKPHDLAPFFVVHLIFVFMRDRDGGWAGSPPPAPAEGA